MIGKRDLLTAVGAAFLPALLAAQNVDYSVVSVPEESGIEFTRISAPGDCVCMPLVRRTRDGIDWLSNRLLDTSPDSTTIAYLSWRNETSNIFVKELSRQGGSTQRTNRSRILDFAYAPDGNTIAFSEDRGQSNFIFLTDARKGYVCRQITSGAKDYSPVYTPDMKQILFARQDATGVSIWGYNIENNFISSYTPGMNPCPVDDESFVCTRTDISGRSEIWKIDYRTGVEECIISDPQRSFTTPCVSPDKEWVLFTGSSTIEGEGFVYRNTDIFVCRIDGTHFAQLTYHAADDLSAVWDRSGKSIYFISQRGNAAGEANIWKMSFQY